MQVWLIACFQIQPKSNYCCDDEENLPHGVMHQDSNWAAYITINLGLLHARCDPSLHYIDDVCIHYNTLGMREPYYTSLYFRMGYIYISNSPKKLT